MTGKFTELSCVVLSGFEHFYLFKLHWHKKVKKVEYELSKQIKRNNISDGVKLQTTAGDFDGFSEVVLYLPCLSPLEPGIGISCSQVYSLDRKHIACLCRHPSPIT